MHNQSSQNNIHNMKFVLLQYMYDNAASVLFNYAIMFMWFASMEMHVFHEHGMYMLCIVYVQIAT